MSEAMKCPRCQGVIIVKISFLAIENQLKGIKLPDKLFLCTGICRNSLYPSHPVIKWESFNESSMSPP